VRRRFLPVNLNAEVPTRVRVPLSYQVLAAALASTGALSKPPRGAWVQQAHRWPIAAGVSPDVTVNASGVSSAVLLGIASVSGAAVVPATGVASPLILGAVVASGAAVVPVTGVSSAAVLGDEVVVVTSPDVTVNVTGVSSAAAVGSVAVTVGGAASGGAAMLTTLNAGMILGRMPAMEPEPVSVRVAAAGVSSAAKVGSVEVASDGTAVVRGVRIFAAVAAVRVINTRSLAARRDEEEFVAALLAA